LNIALNPPSDWLLELRVEESCNVSHEHLDEVKEILEKLSDDSQQTPLAGIPDVLK
jgi:hypothetical protein